MYLNKSENKNVDNLHFYLIKHSGVSGSSNQKNICCMNPFAATNPITLKARQLFAHLIPPSQYKNYYKFA